MASDAYMKLDGFAGETKDVLEAGWEGGGAFEIASFNFTHSPDDSESGTKDAGAKTAKGSSAADRTSSANKGSSKPSFTIQKGLDYASPNLVRRCCDRKIIDWGIVYFREMGDPGRIPYLVLEFGQLHILKFDWQMEAGAQGEEAAKVESITFEFETLLIKYAKQSATGTHEPAHINMWNFKGNDNQVKELDKSNYLGESDDGTGDED